MNISRSSHRSSLIRRMAFGVAALLAFLPSHGIAGPPFFTDDPFPVAFLHWEFYLSSVQQHMREETNATLPHFEVNYGALPQVQLHIVIPIGYHRSADGTHYGLSDTEVGLKYRFLDETDDLPQVGIFPLVEIPTGDQGKQLGGGTVQAYLPVWFQKSWGKFTTYGGGGFWYNPGKDTKNWMFAGWQAQYDLSEAVSLGGEVYYHSQDRVDTRPGTAFNVGGYLNLNESSHILFSVGHSLSGAVATTVYVGYLLTI